MLGLNDDSNNTYYQQRCFSLAFQSQRQPNRVEMQLRSSFEQTTAQRYPSSNCTWYMLISVLSVLRGSFRYSNSCVDFDPYDGTYYYNYEAKGQSHDDAIPLRTSDTRRGPHIYYKMGVSATERAEPDSPLHFTPFHFKTVHPQFSLLCQTS